MHGGILSTKRIVILPQQDALVAAFSHYLYFFSLAEATITNRFTHHKSKLITIHYQSKNKTLTSIDQTGVVFTSEIDSKAQIIDLKKATIDTTSPLVDAQVILGSKGELQVYVVSQNGNFLRFADGVTGSIGQNIKKILYVSQEILIVSSSKTVLSVYSTATCQLKYQYYHNYEVNSVEVYRSNLLIGDSKGKISILNNFLQNGQVQLKQKLEWHVHEVSALKIEQNYLYSGGQEGVVVLWHLRQNKRDFLPRVGAQILNIQIIQSKVYCLLADNTIKVIDLNNDKAIFHYKTIVSPQLKLICPSSAGRVRNNLVRVSPILDQIYLRSQPGRIQSIRLNNGVNTEWSIVGRNATSRLDMNLPNPHQITDIAFSRDGNQFVASIEGINCRSLKFYFQDQGSFQLLSKVQNCHKGSASIHLLSFGDSFVSYSESDCAIKVWIRMTRRKESILQVDQHYWACEYEISYRQKKPRFVSSCGDSLAVQFANQFVLFNTRGRKIEGLYCFDSEKVIALYQLQPKRNQFLVVSQNYIDKIDLLGNKQRIIDISKLNCSFSVDQIAYSQKEHSFAFLVHLQNQQNVFIYKVNSTVTLLEIETNQTRITDLFWVGNTLISLDSSLMLQNLTNQRNLVNFKVNQVARVQEEQIEQDQTQINDYQHLYTKYLERQFRRDRSNIDKSSEFLQVTPSISSSLQLFTSQLFI